MNFKEKIDKLNDLLKDESKLKTMVKANCFSNLALSTYGASGNLSYYVSNDMLVRQILRKELKATRAKIKEIKASLIE
jgi:hypothetical protein